MSASGTKRTCEPDSDVTRCLLMTQSGRGVHGVPFSRTLTQKFDTHQPAAPVAAARLGRMPSRSAETPRAPQSLNSHSLSFLRAVSKSPKWYTHRQRVLHRRCRVTGIGLAGSKVIWGLMPITASGSRVNRYRCPTAARIIAASIKAKLFPTHIRCPPPNG